MASSKVQDRVKREEYGDWVVVVHEQWRQRVLASVFIQRNIQTGSRFNALTIIREDENQGGEQSKGLFQFGNHNQFKNDGANMFDVNKDDNKAASRQVTTKGIKHDPITESQRPILLVQKG